jgi:hypothetical protein
MSKNKTPETSEAPAPRSVNRRSRTMKARGLVSQMLTPEGDVGGFSIRHGGGFLACHEVKYIPGGCSAPIFDGEGNMLGYATLIKGSLVLTENAGANRNPRFGTITDVADYLTASAEGADDVETF